VLEASVVDAAEDVGGLIGGLAGGGAVKDEVRGRLDELAGD
jgi:hypothetical protein